MSLQLVSQTNSIKYISINKDDAASLLKKVNKWYSTTPSYSVEIIHSTYAGHTSIKSYESSKGYLKKYNSGFHSCIMNVHTFQNKNYSLTIDSAQRIILFNNAYLAYEKNYNLPTEDFLKLIDKCSELKVAYEDSKDILRLEFNKKHNIEAYELIIKKEGMLQELDVFYSKAVKSKSGELVKPKFQIRYEKYKIGISPSKNELNENVYIITNSNGAIQTTSEFKEFKLIDQRYKYNNP